MHEPCKLYCTDKDDTFIQAFENVEDGTPCKIGTKDMCISGICKVNKFIDFKHSTELIKLLKFQTARRLRLGC